MIKWIIGIIVLLVVVYGGYRVYHHYSYQQQMQKQTVMQNTAPTATKTSPTEAMQSTVYKTMTDKKLGNIMTDEKGMTLYTYAKDTSGVSNCSGQCLAIWPAYIAPAGKNTLPADISVIKRSDGMTQYAYKGMPLYYYAKDKAAGDVNGDGVGGVWSVVKL